MSKSSAVKFPLVIQLSHSVGAFIFETPCRVPQRQLSYLLKCNDIKSMRTSTRLSRLQHNVALQRQTKVRRILMQSRPSLQRYHSEVGVRLSPWCVSTGWTPDPISICRLSGIAAWAGAAPRRPLSTRRCVIRRTICRRFVKLYLSFIRPPVWNSAGSVDLYAVRRATVLRGLNSWQKPPYSIV